MAIVRCTPRKRCDFAGELHHQDNIASVTGMVIPLSPHEFAFLRVITGSSIHVSNSRCSKVEIPAAFNDTRASVTRLRRGLRDVSEPLCLSADGTSYVCFRPFDSSVICNVSGFQFSILYPDVCPVLLNKHFFGDWMTQYPVSDMLSKLRMQRVCNAIDNFPLILIAGIH